MTERPFSVDDTVRVPDNPRYPDTYKVHSVGKGTMADVVWIRVPGRDTPVALFADKISHAEPRPGETT